MRKSLPVAAAASRRDLSHWLLLGLRGVMPSGWPEGRGVDEAQYAHTMTIVDPTTTSAWSELTRIADGFTPDLRAWLSDAERVRQLTFSAGDLHVDLSKNLVTTEVLDSLLDLAEQVGLEARRDAMIRGDRINVTENRSVLHTALRRPRGDSCLLYTSDAADDLTRVDLGGRRIIKKKKKYY